MFIRCPPDDSPAGCHVPSLSDMLRGVIIRIVIPPFASDIRIMIIIMVCIHMGTYTHANVRTYIFIHICLVCLCVCIS